MVPQWFVDALALLPFFIGGCAVVVVLIWSVLLLAALPLGLSLRRASSVTRRRDRAVQTPLFQNYLCKECADEYPTENADGTECLGIADATGR